MARGVVTLDEAKEKMGVFLLAALCMVNVQVHTFITSDVKVENVNGTCPLTGAKAADITQGRKHAWVKTREACAVDMLMENEVNLLYSTEDEGLLAEIKKGRSCCNMMGLDDYERIGKTGLMGSTEDFNSKHLAFVNHFVRGAQASFRLGRPTNLASFTIHLSVNELPPGVKVNSLEEERTMMYNPGESTSFSLGMRCVLARARVKDCGENSDGRSSTCQFLMRFPLYRLLDLSRFDGLSLSPTTEHSTCVSPTCHHGDAYS